MLIREMLIQAAERYPDREAIIDGDQRLTYAEWNDRVFRLAAWLSDHGLGRGDRVAIGMRNTLDHVTVFTACQLLGAGAVPFNIHLKAGSVAHVVHDSGANALVLDDCMDLAELRDRDLLPADLVWIDAAPKRARRYERAALFSDYRAAAPLGQLPPQNREDVSAIIYTSGTTGLPKGVPITQGNAYARLVTHIMSVGPTFNSGAKTFGAAPLYHTVGMHWVFLQTLFANGTYYPVSRLNEKTAALIRDEELTFLYGSPTLFRLLLDVAPAATLPSVRNIAYGSAPAEPELLAGLFELCPNAQITEVYGTTELSIPFVTPSMRGLTPGTLQPTGDHRVRVVAPAGGPEDVVAPGELGELLVHVGNRGIFSGYWGPAGQDKRDTKCVDGWFRTGDGFRYDTEGNFYFDGRLDDMFASGGENIQPAEVENILNGMPGIVDSAVVGAPDPKWSNIVTAFIVTDGRGIDTADVDEYFRNSALENYKRPRIIHFVDGIPRNPSGKIVRGQVMARFMNLIDMGRSGVETASS